MLLQRTPENDGACDRKFKEISPYNKKQLHMGDIIPRKTVTCRLNRLKAYLKIPGDFITAFQIHPEERRKGMKNRALVVIDLQNDITKNYREIIDQVNRAIDWAAKSDMHVVYIQNNNLSAGTRTFKPGTHGAELVPEMKRASENVFVKTKSNALTSEAFAAFIAQNGVNEFYLAGADATACVKSTSYNMAKAGYAVHVLADCITSYDKKKIDEMLRYYAEKGCAVETLDEAMRAAAENERI